MTPASPGQRAIPQPSALPDFDETALALESPGHGGLAPGDALRVDGRAEGGADPVVAVRIRLNGELVAEPSVDEGRFAAVLDVEQYGSRLDLRLTGVRRSGATARVKLLTVWRPAIAPRRERIAPLIVEYAVADGRLSGRASGPDIPAAIELWRRGRAQPVAVGEDGAFAAELDADGDGRVHLWARFRYDRPDAYVGPAGEDPSPQGSVTLETAGGAIVAMVRSARAEASSRSRIREAVAERFSRRAAFVNGRPAILKRAPGTSGGFTIEPAGWGSPDRIEIEILDRAGSRLGTAEGWNTTGLPIRAFMTASAERRALRARRAGVETVLRVRRVNPSGDDMVFIAEDDSGGFEAVPLSTLAGVHVARDTPFASDPAETPSADMAAFIKTLPAPGYRLKTAEGALGSVVLPCAGARPAPARIHRVVLVRPGPNATDELYVLRPLEPLLARAGIAFEIAEPGGGVRPDRPLEEGTVVIVSRSADDAWLARLVEDRRSIFIVYLMDDDPPAAADSPGVPQRYRARMIEACRSDFSAMLRLSDRFVATSPGLATRWASPKTVLLEPPFIRAPDGLGHFDDLSRLRIAYHGTDVHRDDIAFLYEPLARLLAAFPGAHLEVISTIRPPKSFAALGNYERIAPMSWTDYVLHARRNPVHLNLAPMLDTPFNRAKSIIKALDTASLGAAGVYSRVAPYDGVVRDGVDGLLVENDPAAWEAALTRLLADPPALRLLAEAGLERARRIGALGKASDVWRAMLGLAR